MNSKSLNDKGELTAEHPGLPFLLLGSRGEVEVCDSSSRLDRASLYSLVRGYFTGLRAFDGSGTRWRVAEVIAPYCVTFWTRLLARTVYNPRFAVTVRWQRDGSYELSELQDALCQAADSDDDILTQFIEPTRLKKLVRHCTSYDQLIAKLRKHQVA